MTDLTTGKQEDKPPRTSTAPLPTATIEFAGTDGAPAGLPVVAAGKSFGLSGSGSTGVAQAEVVAYIWTLLPE